MFKLAKEIGAAPCLRYWFWQNWRIMLTCAFGDLAVKNMNGQDWISKSTIRNNIFICKYVWYTIYVSIILYRDLL